MSEAVDLLEAVMCTESDNPGMEIFKYSLNAESDPDAFPALETALRDLQEDARKASVSKQDGFSGMTPLFYAVVGQSAKAVECLIKAGAEPSAPDVYGYTPLHHAAGMLGNVEMTKCLLENGADPDFANNTRNFSPLYVAAYYKHPEIIKVLRKHNANPCIPTVNGFCALDAAGDHKECKILLMEMLEEKAARKEKEGNACDNCSDNASDLKRCARCYAMFYCSRECQKEHWKNSHKQNCKGYITATLSPRSVAGEEAIETACSNIPKVPGQNMDINRTVNDEKAFKKLVSNHGGRYFIVKVQMSVVPLGNMLVHCEDRCCPMYICHADDKQRYNDLASLIENCEALGGMGYFWAEITDTVNKGLKVFYSQQATPQKW